MDIKLERSIAKFLVRQLIARHEIASNRLPKEGRYTHTLLSPPEIDWLWKNVFTHHPESDNVASIVSVRPGRTQHGTTAFYVTWIHTDGTEHHDQVWAWSSCIDKAHYTEIIDPLPC